MPCVYDAGKVCVSKSRVSWILEDLYRCYPRQVDTKIYSPHFSCLGREWWLALYPNGLSSSKTEDWLGIWLVNETDRTQFHVRFGIKGRSGNDMMIANFNGRGRYPYLLLRFIQKSEFDSRKNEILLPSGDLNIFCQILTMVGGAAHGKPDGGVGEDEAEVTGVEVSTQTEAKICHFKNMFGDRSRTMMLFLVISAVLASCLFLGIVEPDRKDTSAGIVPKEDLDPDTSDFLHYLCAGGGERVTLRNILDLLIASDKYDVKEIKNVCLKFMVDNICIENFSDVLDLSLYHRETELTDAITRFFIKNGREIIVTTKWQAFLTENPIAGNKLLIKYFQNIKKTMNPG